MKVMRLAYDLCGYVIGAALATLAIAGAGMVIYMVISYIQGLFDRRISPQEKLISTAILIGFLSIVASLVRVMVEPYIGAK